MTEIFFPDEDWPDIRQNIPKYIRQLQDFLREKIGLVIPAALPGDTLIWGTRFSVNTQNEISHLEVLVHFLNTKRNTNIQTSIGERRFEEESEEELEKLQVFILMGIYFHLTSIHLGLQQGDVNILQESQKCIVILAQTLHKIHKALTERQAHPDTQLIDIS